VTGTLQFFAPEHRYELDGQRLPSVTQILQSAGLIDYSMVPRDLLEKAKARGTRVHLACAYLDEGDLDPRSVSEEDAGYVAAYERFKRETSFEPRLIEHRVYHRSLRYAGTLDRTGTIGQQLFLIDIKTGDPQPSAFVQLAAYHACCLFEDFVFCRRRVLHLRADGTYALIAPKDDCTSVPAGEMNVFRAALVVHQWKESNR
jgi:hypothetical protein